METPIYFLFGEDACRDWSEGGIKSLKKAVKNNEYNPCTYEFTGNVIELMEQYTGWNDYCILTKEEFDKINDL